MITPPHILLVEDDREIRTLVARYLGNNECRVSQARDGREMDRIMVESHVDLVVLDLMLPGEDGLALCRRLRAVSAVPIVILSARGEEVDRIVGLEVGADDYIAKPFNPRELLARLRAVLRRTSLVRGIATAPTARRYVFLGWQLDLMTGQLVDPNGVQVTITGAETDLLRVFCERPGRILARDQLIELTQGRSTGSSERSIDILVSRLRRKIAPLGTVSDLIRTVRSGGYVFIPEVTVVP